MPMFTMQKAVKPFLLWYLTGMMLPLMQYCKKYLATNELKVLETALAYSLIHFSFLLPSIVKSEKTINLLTDAIYTSNNIQHKLNKINGLEADAIKQKFHL
jgi:hypothetical protein